MNISLSQPLTKPTKRRLFKRLLLRCFAWIEFPTPKEKMWASIEMGKVLGRQELLREIRQKQPSGPMLPVRQPTGTWRREYFHIHPEFQPRLEQPVMPPALPDWVLQAKQQSIEIEDCSWLNDVPVIQPAFDKEATLQVPAIMQFLHKTKQGVEGNAQD